MSEAFGILITFLPLFVIMILANIAEKQRRAGEPYRGTSMFAYFLLAGFYMMAFVAGGLIQLGGFALTQQPELLDEILAFTDGVNPLEQISSLNLLGMGLWIPALIGSLLLMPFIRRLLAQFIPIDASSPVHAVALSSTMLILINLLFTLGIGLANFNTLLEEAAADGANLAGSFISLWSQQIVMAILAAVGVGLFTRYAFSPQGFSTTMKRLGIEIPSFAQVVQGFFYGILLVPVAGFVGFLGSLTGFGPDPDVEVLAEQLLGPLLESPFGILTIGLAAALGEEPLFRGALQPRFGLLLTALLFAILHSNYGISISTVVVFVLGLALGWIRIQHNTTTSMITHAVYNMSLGIISYLSLPFFDA
ncbi:MAG: CPBP family intramembrane glutamic endopeptidase [Chloroflexota bacterium]